MDGSATRSVGGTGLGLYVCKKLSEMIGARLWLERSERDGSVFCLLIPKPPPGFAILSAGDPERQRTAPTQSITASF